VIHFLAGALKQGVLRSEKTGGGQSDLHDDVRIPVEHAKVVLLESHFKKGSKRTIGESSGRVSQDEEILEFLYTDDSGGELAAWELRIFIERCAG
jgi:hypothetical protein